MAENKTKPGKESVEEFIETLETTVQQDCKTLIKIMKKISGKNPVMWGNIVGFGQFHYKYASGREGEYFLTGFMIVSKVLSPKSQIPFSIIASPFVFVASKK